MTRPFVGLPSTTDGVCTYAAHLDQPLCGVPATVHVLGRAGGWGLVNLPTCDDHLSIARAGCAEIADEHPAEGCDGEHYAPGEPA